MMEVSSYPGPPGPSRSRRPPPPTPPQQQQQGEQDLADRFVTMQRNHASHVNGNVAGPSASRSRRPASPAMVDDFSRSPRAGSGSSKLFDPNSDMPRSPRKPTSDQHRGQRTQSPGHTSSRRPAGGEFSRGLPPDAPQRILFDPKHPAPPLSRSHPPASRSETPPAIPRHLEDEGRRRPHAHGSNSSASSSRRPELSSSRQLFDPNQHDPIQFHGRLDAPSLNGSSRSFPRIRSKEEEADRERERRKRKEGSERGMAKRKEHGAGADSKSKGSRSSEGSESFKDRERGKGRGDGGVKVILKDIYDKVKTLELELNDAHKAMAHGPNSSMSVSRDRIEPAVKKPSGGVDTSVWLDLIVKHKELADLHHEFLVRVFDPLVPSSLHQLTVRYNIPSRLWQSGFHLILERLRLAWQSGQSTALDLLTDLVYDAYKFYTDLLEDQSLANFRTAWIEALGDLARYRMAIATFQANEAKEKEKLANKAGNVPVRHGHQEDGAEAGGSSGASIGAEVAQQWDVEDKETWRTTARDWYTMGITEKPGEGRLHHHLALLSRDVRGQEPRALHHFTKSLTVTHEFESARESILPLFDSALQSQRSLPDATAMDLFVRLHGMLFTRIQLDDLPTVMSRFLERLEEDASLEGVSRKVTITQVDWMLMASINITAMLQYGSGSGIIRKALAQEGAERRRQHATVPEEGEIGEEVEDEEGGASGDSDGKHDRSPPPPNGNGATDEPPSLSFTSALRLSFSILDHCLQHPRRLQGMTHVLNPFITLSLTFIATLFRQSHVGAILLPSLPWVRLVEFFNSAPDEIREETRLINGAPLPEDWCIRGMEWVGRRVYERGFWKSKGSGHSHHSRGSGGMMAQPKIGERFQSEMDVLLANFDAANPVDINEGVVEEVDGTDLTDGPVAINQRRWRRVAWAAGVMAKHVDGLDLDFDPSGRGRLVIRGQLADKLAELEAARMAEEDLARSKIRPTRDTAASAQRELELLDAEIEVDGLGESDGDDADLAMLRERRRHLRSLVQAPGSSVSRSTRTPHPRGGLRVVPGYTMLVFDTNVLLSSLALFSRLVESGQWSIIIPLPVVTELDGLSREPAPLGTSAKAAVAYLESRIRTHSLCLKIQTTKGNYLSDLLIRTEAHHASDASDMGNGNGKERERTMDDRILNIASFQVDHFADRSTILGSPAASVEKDSATKVVLVTFDRNLRLKARAKGMDAADEKEMTAILGK